MPTGRPSRRGEARAIEAAFRECERQVLALQQAAYAAPAAGIQAPPGALEPPRFALLRGRVDELARNALETVDEIKQGLCGGVQQNPA